MNATEARKLAEQNGEKIAENQLADAIESMESQIVEKAKIGHFGATIEINCSEQWREFGCTDSFIKHFSDRGYNVETLSVTGSIVLLMCRW